MTLRVDRLASPAEQLSLFEEPASLAQSAPPSALPGAGSDSHEIRGTSRLMGKDLTMTTAPFVHLHVHSDYSPMRGVSSLEELCVSAQRQGMPAMALTDTNGLYGAIRFIEHGEAAQVTADSRRRTHDRRPSRSAVGQNARRLCQPLPSAVRTPLRSVVQFYRVDRRYRSGLILITDDEQALTAWAQESPEDLYVELTPGPAMITRCVQPPDRSSARRDQPRALCETGRFCHASPASRHRPQYDAFSPAAQPVVRLRIGSCRRRRWHTIFRMSLPRLENTGRIADACHTDWSFGDTIFPAFRQLSDGEASICSRKNLREVRSQRYGTLSLDIRERIEHELTLIHEKALRITFLIVEEIVRQAPRTCGRGSVAASIVSYCLGITHVDPIKHHLFFERFLNPGRKDPPDIDIDFPWDERDDILEWVFKTYGGQQAAMVANQNTLASRRHPRNRRKSTACPPKKSAGFLAASCVARTFCGSTECPSRDHMGPISSRRDLQLKAPWPDIPRRRRPAQNHFRHLSLHCGGIVIVPDEIRHYVPVEIAAKGCAGHPMGKRSNGRGRTSQNRSLRQSLPGRHPRRAERHRTQHRPEDRLCRWDPLNDPATQELIRRGDTMGCFYIESPATRLLLKKLWSGMPADRRPYAMSSNIS